MQKSRCSLEETEGEDMFKSPVIHLLTVPSCGSLLPVFGVRVSMTFHLMCVPIIFSSDWLLSGHLLGKSCSLG